MKEKKESEDSLISEGGLLGLGEVIRVEKEEEEDSSHDGTKKALRGVNGLTISILEGGGGDSVNESFEGFFRGLSDSKEQLSDSKEQLSDSKEQLRDSKEQLRDSKEQLSDNKEWCLVSLSALLNKVILR